MAATLRTPASAPPERRLAGARAAQAWSGWAEVDRLLRGAAWLDGQFGGEGRELLARSELERGRDAVPNAQLALGAAGTDAPRVVRHVLLARAHDRAGARDSAASHYLAAAARLPLLSDWLHLRTAGVLADSAARATQFAQVRGAAARARIAPTDAQARERAGDLAGAERAFLALGDASAAFRVAALGSRDDVTRGALARRIVAYLGNDPRAAEVRLTVEVLDQLGAALSPVEELTVARASAAHGAAARAAAGFDRAGQLAPADRLVHAGALARSGRTGDALRQYASLSTAAVVAPLAGYQRARLLVQSGSGAAGRSALRDVIAAHPTVRSAAAPALLLLADLQVDDADHAGASRSLAELLRRHPDASQAPLARFRAGLLLWASAPAGAAAQFDSLVARYPGDEEVNAARYWAGRAYDRLGQRVEAERRWTALTAAAPLSYYAALVARRMSRQGWQAPTGADTIPRSATLDSAARRIGQLERVGMDAEARFELEALAAFADSLPAAADVIAQMLVQLGHPSRAIRVATRALDRGATSRPLYRAAFPIVHVDALREESLRHGLDPALVAGLVRQESSWNPRALSPANARGLMQLLPSVGASIAASKRYPLWNESLLFEPDVSLELGTVHLGGSLAGGAPPARALAAYNAGASRVARWIRRPGTADAELFAEWIPYTETRDYVRIVQRNATIYRALYPELRGAAAAR